MDIDRKQIVETLIGVIDHISDQDYQIRIWINGEGPEVDDFDETVCWFFDIGDPVLDDYKAFGITEIQYKVLKKIRDQFRTFSDENYWPGDFIDTPEWARIMDMAKDVLKAFNYKRI